MDIDELPLSGNGAKGDKLKQLAEQLRFCEEQLKKKQLQLEEINRTLEQRVREEVEKNREKEHLLILQNRQAAMGEMIGNIAHQWRQPLTSISLLIQDLGECFDYGELTREYLDSTISNAMNVIQHMSQTIDDFRNFFKQEKERQPYSVSQVIGRSLSFTETSLRYANINIRIDADEDIVLTGFPNELSQVLLNIIGNAKDIFLERKTVNPELRIKAFRENGKTVITISDNGGGIREEIISRIFEPYFSHREEQDRTGIGLYMAKTIIEKNMGGRLSAENIEGGASFRIEI